MIEARIWKRPAPGAGWRAMALHVGPALLLAATVLPTLLLQERLPRYQQAPYQAHAISWSAGVLATGACLVAAWFAVLVFASTGSPHRRPLWGLWVPLLYAAGGLAVAITVPDLILNLDRRYSLPGGAGGLPRWAFTWAAVAACASIGVLLGRRAAATMRAPTSANRAVWIAEVDADRSWWLLQGALALAAALLLAAPALLAGYVSEPLEGAASVLATFGLGAAWASTGLVTISPMGIRVALGHVRLYGWELPIEQITSVDVASVQVCRPSVWIRSWRHLALRDGRALIVSTRSGGRHVVTVPDADDAAAVLKQWITDRSKAAGRHPGTPGSTSTH